MKTTRTSSNSESSGGRSLDCYSFGRELLRLNDLDPVYVAVWNAGLDQPTLRRWLLAYWCFYHVGTASWIADRPTEFWDRLWTAARSKNYPRSRERRHFRGENARKSVKYLQGRGLSGLFADVEDAGPTAADVVKAVRGWVGFGPWIAFKVADMVERLAVRPVEFDLATAMYDSPREAAELLWREEHPGAGRRSPERNEGEWAVGRILHELARSFPQDVGRAGEPPVRAVAGKRSGFPLAPPRYERGLNVQEAETILCKWKSYRGGHYRLGEDVEAVREGLQQYTNCRLADRLSQGGVRGGLWNA